MLFGEKLSEEYPDAYEKRLARKRERSEQAQQAAFGQYILETTGFDGQQFSLTEAERAWITRANEVIEWLRLVGPRGDNPHALHAALRCVASLKPMPSSLSSD